VIEARMRARDHFMPVSLLESQYQTLEPPERALVLNAAEPPQSLVRQVLGFLRRPEEAV
jgi:gluconate kinase